MKRIIGLSLIVCMAAVLCGCKITIAEQPQAVTGSAEQNDTNVDLDAIITSNAVGSLRADYPVGTLVCIEDHIASFVPDVLIGPNDDSLGERFVGMSNIYDSDLRKTAHEVADELGIDLLDGVYLQVTGPSYESKAESEMYAALGADIVGMSTACEAMALKQMNVKVLSISCITDFCPNVNNDATTHEEVLKNAEKVSSDFVRLIKTIVSKY